MTDTNANKWAITTSVVLENFCGLIDRAQQFEAQPLTTPNDQADVYARRKFQLVYSMLFYINRMISDGIKFVMKGLSTDCISETLVTAYGLQQRLLAFGNLPKDLQEACQQFEDEMDFRCPNPLVLFLKLALESGQYRRDLQQIQNLLRDLSLSTDSEYEKFFPGMPACVLALKRDEHDLIVSATMDQYQHTTNLHSVSQDLWRNQLKRQSELCSEVNKDRVLNLEKLSDDFVKMTNISGVRKDKLVKVNDDKFREFLQDRATDPTQMRVDFTGAVASWNADGTYKPSCLLDHYRFETNRPSGNQKPSRGVWGSTSCAEWFCFLELASLHEKVTEAPLLGEMNADESSYAKRIYAEAEESSKES